MSFTPRQSLALSRRRRCVPPVGLLDASMKVPIGDAMIAADLPI